MAYFDFPLEKLWSYCPPRSEPADFDAFWERTLRDTRQYDLDARFVPVATSLRTVQAFDVTFNGYGGQAIKGWLMLPSEMGRQLPSEMGRQLPSEMGRQQAAQIESKLPCVVEYLGYGGGRSLPESWLEIANSGYAHLIMDTRGQGSSWSPGDTPDLEPGGFPPQTPGFRTRGLPDRERYYLRRLFTDALRAVEAARAHPAIDPLRVAVAGGSQGGGMALAAAGLAARFGPALCACLADVPSMCHIRRGLGIAGADTTTAEIVAYLRTHRLSVETVLAVLDAFDGVNFAARATAPALFSVGLMDPNCPPSTVFAAYNHYAGPKEIRVYEYNEHEGGGIFQTAERLTFLRQLWGWR